MMNQLATMTFDAERSLISCLRWEDDEAYKIFAYAIENGISNDFFEDESCMLYWNALVQSEREGEFGKLSVWQRLPNTFHEQFPDFNQVVLEAHEVPSEHKGVQAIDQIIKGKTLRQLTDIGNDLVQKVSESAPLDDPINLASSTESRLQEIVKPKSKTLADSNEVTSRTISEIRRCLEEGPARIAPNLPWLKRGLKGGFKDSHLVAVAARPSVGKTTITLNWVYNSALKGQKSLFFSLEMKAEALWEKMGLIRSKTEHGLDYRTDDKELNRKNAETLIKNIEECRNLPIFIDDSGSLSMSQIISTSKIMHRKHNLDCIVIDYLGLVRPDDPKMPREQQVAEISKSAKALAKEINRPVFMICQLNRDSVKNGAEPQLHNLRESGQIEQDADVAILLHRDLLGDDKFTTKVIVAKQRFGGTGHSNKRIKFKAHSQRFIEVEQNSLNDGYRDKTLYEDIEPRI